MGLQDRLTNNLTGNFQTNTSDTLTDIQKRTQNMLLNPKEQVKKAVEKGQIKITDTEKKIYDAAPEVDVDTSSQDNNTSSQDLTSRDAALALFDYVRLLNPIGQMMLVAEEAAGSNQGLHNEDVRDTLVDALPQVVSNSVNSAGQAVNQVTETTKKTVDKTVNNVLPADIGKKLGLALYGILAVLGIGVFLYILSALKPLFEIGSNVSDK